MNPKTLGEILYQAAELSKENRHGEAAEILSSAIIDYPDTGLSASVLHYNYGLELSAIGKHKPALEEFRTAVELNPDDADAWNEIGRIRIDMRELGAAKQALEHALELHPGHPDAWNNLGVVHFLRARYSDAVNPAFESAVEANPGLADAWFNLADAREENGDRKGASEARARLRKLSQS